MVFLKRTLDLTQYTLDAGSLSGFSDASQVKDYAREAVSALVGAGVIDGTDGRLNPGSNITRAENGGHAVPRNTPVRAGWFCLL